MQSLATTHSASHDSSQLIPHVESKINVFRNQLIFDTTRSEYLCKHPYPGYTRHLIPLKDGSLANLANSLQSYLRPTIISGVKIPEAKHTPTLIPNYPYKILHIDIFVLEKKLYLSCIDNFSKFAKLFHLQSEASVHLRETLVEALHNFTAPKVLVSDNE